MRSLVGSSLALLLTAVISPALAGSISIQITPTPTWQDGTLKVGLKVSNVGDEAARAVSAVLDLQAAETRGAPHDVLGPKDSFEETLSLPAGGIGPGQWPYRVAVDYTDANHYPFQALHVSTATMGTPPPAKVALQELRAPSFSGSTTLRGRVKNLAAVARKVAVSVYAPEGLEATGATSPIELAPWEEKQFSATLINRTVLAGSRYPVFVAAEYDDGGTHQALVGFSIVEIVAAGSAFSSNQTTLWVGAAALVGLWLVFLLVRVLRKNA